MKELKTAPKSMLKFDGTPEEIGSEIWARMCLPAVNAVSKKLDTKAVAQLYIGFLSSVVGSMCADFGTETATSYAQVVIDIVREAKIDQP